MSDWQGLLAQDEVLLWQGRPQVRYDWTLLIHKNTPKGLFIALFAAAWIGLALSVTGDNEAPLLMRFLFHLIGLPILWKGLQTAFGPSVRSYHRLKGSTYSLTNRSAFIATSIGGKRQLERFDLHDGTLTPSLEEGDPGSVWFITRSKPDGTWQIGASATEQIGFERIPEARQVYRMMLDALSNRPPKP